MALPLLAGLAGVAGKAALKKIAKTMAKKKAKNKQRDFEKNEGVIQGNNPIGSTGVRNRNSYTSGESDSIGLSDEFNVDDFRKGGKVKKITYGGKVKKTGARRGDGCAVRGKTRGRMI
jgi:hypothetical protein